MKRLTLTTLLCLLIALNARADESTHLYWGDLHVHSNRSPDSFAFGNQRLTPDDAFRFAKGEAIKSNSGSIAQLTRPLDFLLVADHAEFVGLFPKLIARDPQFMKTEVGKRWSEMMDSPDGLAPVVREWAQLIAEPDYEQELSPEFRTEVWRDNIAFADSNNEPGKFTAFIGYEWTAMVNGNNLHRVVLFRDNADLAGQLPPFSSLDSQDPEDLWNALGRYETVTGGRVMAIPHNGNVSNGMMFMTETLAGKPFDRAYAETRIRWEPLYEVTQVKGDGETHPFLSPDDEFADFETWDADNIGRNTPKTNDMLAGEYARSALREGLALQRSLGVNPYEFGLIGSTDSHTPLATADDNNFYGKFLDSEKTPDRLSNQMGGSLWYNWRLAASGYLGVWAKENTRTGLFDALEQKEVYATTGPRIPLRFFAGWQFSREDLSTLVASGYYKGVPMGSRLEPLPGNSKPGFLISALKDPDGANLDRIQVVKGFLKADGSTGEKVYDVAWDTSRQPGADGKLPPVGNTVNLEDPSYSNTIGSPALSTFWQDPDFDASQPAFYYVRVLEIPTPRWSAYDAAEFDTDAAEEIPMVTVERVYSSPIWYNPG